MGFNVPRVAITAEAGYATQQRVQYTGNRRFGCDLCAQHAALFLSGEPALLEIGESAAGGTRHVPQTLRPVQ